MAGHPSLPCQLLSFLNFLLLAFSFSQLPPYFSILYAISSCNISPGSPSISSLSATFFYSFLLLISLSPQLYFCFLSAIHMQHFIWQLVHLLHVSYFLFQLSFVSFLFPLKLNFCFLSAILEQHFIWQLIHFFPVSCPSFYVSLIAFSFSGFLCVILLLQMAVLPSLP